MKPAEDSSSTKKSTRPKRKTRPNPRYEGPEWQPK
ncbi:unnamed protein product [Urochloa humidicola]